MFIVPLAATLLALDQPIARGQPRLVNLHRQAQGNAARVCSPQAAVGPARDSEPQTAVAMSTRDGAALIAGTAIGGGFLALPAVTAPMGFAPSVLCLVLVWGFLALNGLALIEATSIVLNYMRDDGKGEVQDEEQGDAGVSFASLTAYSLGPVGALVCSSAFVAQMLAVVTAQAREP